MGLHLNLISAMEKRGPEFLTSGLDTINRVVRALESLGIEFTNGAAIRVGWCKAVEGKGISERSRSLGSASYSLTNQLLFLQNEPNLGPPR